MKDEILKRNHFRELKKQKKEEIYKKKIKNLEERLRQKDHISKLGDSLIPDDVMIMDRKFYMTQGVILFGILL